MGLNWAKPVKPFNHSHFLQASLFSCNAESKSESGYSMTVLLYLRTSQIVMIILFGDDIFIGQSY